MKLLCFGDSITWGAWDVDGGWVSRIRRRVDQLCIDSHMQRFVLTYNMGISSDTSERVLERMPAAILAHSYEEHDFTFIISLGTNDSVWRSTEQRFWVPIDQFEDNMSKIVELAKQHSDKVLLLGSAGIDESKTHPYTYQDDIESSNADIRRYDEVTQRVAASAGAIFVPVFDSFMENDYLDMLYEDGVHPNGAGHEFIARTVWPHVEQWIA